MTNRIPGTFTLGYEHNLGDFSVHTEALDRKDYTTITLDEAMEWAKSIHENTTEHYESLIDEAMEDMTFPRYRYNMTPLDEQEYRDEVMEQMTEELAADLPRLANYLYNWAHEIEQAAHAAHMLATIEPSEAELADAQDAEETEFQSVLEYVAEQHGLSAEALERAILFDSAFTREEWVSGIAHRALAKPLAITFRQVMENIASDEAAQ